ncbi:MAG: hypothetical protein ISS26_00990 [Candidatus Omnitrophica bacterium]|nr:hypothetical protein [Candidatus Omnitrophota bacterium]
MRLIKFFPKAESIDNDINAWVRESPQQRCILQITPYGEGVIVLYEKVSSHEDEWESIKKHLMKKAKKDTLKRGTRRGK